LEPGKDVQLLPSGGNEGRLIALETKRAVAAVHSTPYNMIGANRGYPVLAWAKDYLASPLNGLIVTDKKLREARDQVKRFIKGTIEGLQYVQEHKEESTDIAMKWMRLDRDTTKAMTDVVFPLYSLDGTMSDEAIRVATETELKRANIKKKLGFNDVADRSVLLEAQKELGLR
jgi:ABC-type nitrate/sulfonate/bicarbonate transport system substrate-binding protein